MPSPEALKVLVLGSGYKGEAACKQLARLKIAHDYCSVIEDLKDCERKRYTHVLYFYDLWHELLMQRKLPPTVNLIAVKDIRFAEKQFTPLKIQVLFEPLLICHLSRVLGSPSGGRAEAGKADGSDAFRIRDGEALVVDDNDVNLLVAVALMEQYGLKPETADSGRAAIEKCSVKKYDIVFMDHMMPEMDGIEAAQRIKKECKPNRRTPIVALTANAVTGMKQVFKDSGMTDFISKPIEIKELTRVLRQQMPKSKIYIPEAEPKAAAGDKKEAAAAPVKKPGKAKIDAQTERRLDELGISYRDALRSVGGSEEVYLSVARAFLLSLKSRIDLLLDCASKLGDADKLKTFHIEAHGMKSALANIGAIRLSASARDLELAAKQSDTSFIEDNCFAFIAELRRLQESFGLIVRPAGGGKEKKKTATGGDKDVFTAELKRIADMIADLDTDAASSAAARLAQKSGYGEYADRLERLQAAIDGFDFDGASAIIAEITR
jgi:CheY-like chemotaxis protein